LYLLSAYGLNSMADLLRGVDPKDISANSLTYPIADIIRQRLSTTADEFGWQPIFIPNQGSLIVNSPIDEQTGQYLQYVMSLATQGWGIWRGVPMVCFDEWRGVTYFGSSNSSVYSMNATRDNVMLSDVEEESGGVAINYSILTAYTDGGDPSSYKMVQFVRPDFISVNDPEIVTRVYYDYEIQEFISNTNPGSPDFDVWDTGQWDVSKWAAGLSGYFKTEGASGIGRTVAVAMRGNSTEETTLMSFDIMWKTGGLI
jgi:hypothetical protein